MAQARPPAARQTLNQVAALYSHDPGQTGLIAGVAFSGLAVIGLWGLYGDLLFSNYSVSVWLQRRLVVLVRSRLPSL